MRSSLAHLLEQLNLTAPDTEDGVVLVTSRKAVALIAEATPVRALTLPVFCATAPLGADPGWVEHAYISTDMEMHCLASQPPLALLACFCKPC